MATAASQKFSTRVKVPHLEGKGAHGETHFISSTHYNIKGKAGSRTSVIRYKGEWYVCSENAAKANSFIQGDKATPEQIPKDAPKAMQTPKQPATKGAKPGGKKAVKKGAKRKGARRNVSQTQALAESEAKATDDNDAGRQVA